MNERFGQVLIVLVTGLVLGLGVFLVTRDGEPPASGASTAPRGRGDHHHPWGTWCLHRARGNHHHDPRRHSAPR